MLVNESTEKCCLDSTEALKCWHCAEDRTYQKTSDTLQSVSKEQWYSFGLGYWLWELTKELPDSETSVADRWIEKAHVISIVEHLLF